MISKAYRSYMQIDDEATTDVGGDFRALWEFRFGLAHNVREEEQMRQMLEQLRMNESYCNTITFSQIEDQNEQCSI